MHPNDGRVVSNFIVQALNGDPITIYGDGSQTRSFCYVDDLIEGFVRLMASPASVTGPVNLGNPGEFTIKELAELVIDMTGSSVGADLPAAAAERSPAAPARHLVGQGGPGMAAERAAARGAQPHDRVFRRFAVDGRPCRRAPSRTRRWARP